MPVEESKVMDAPVDNPVDKNDDKAPRVLYRWDTAVSPVGQQPPMRGYDLDRWVDVPGELWEPVSLALEPGGTRLVLWRRRQYSERVRT